jgi:hypothetical protein
MDRRKFIASAGTEGLEWTKLDTQLYLPAKIEKEVFRKEP